MLAFTRVLTSVSCVVVLAFPAMSRADLSEQEKDTGSTTTPQAGVQKSVDEIARQMYNPLAAFTSVGYKVDYRTYKGNLPGAGDQSLWTHALQTVFPFAWKNGKGYVLRLTLPLYLEKPVYKSDRGYPDWLIRLVDPVRDVNDMWDPVHGHTGDMDFDLVYGGVNDDGLIFMYGVAGMLPTSSDTSNARQQLVMGPELNIGRVTDWGTYGTVFSHVMDIIEKRDKHSPDTMITSAQVYFSYGLGNGWEVFSNPSVIYDWEADGGNKLSVPLGAGVAKTTKIGKMPIKIAAELQNYVVGTDRFSPDWLFRFSFTPVIPNKYTRH